MKRMLPKSCSHWVIEVERARVTGVLTVMIRGVVMGLVKVATLSVPLGTSGAPLVVSLQLPAASFFHT